MLYKLILFFMKVINHVISQCKKFFFVVSLSKWKTLLHNNLKVTYYVIKNDIKRLDLP